MRNFGGIHGRTAAPAPAPAYERASDASHNGRSGVAEYAGFWHDGADG